VSLLSVPNYQANKGSVLDNGQVSSQKLTPAVTGPSIAVDVLVVPECYVR
jgi:hypothetical protein